LSLRKLPPDEFEARAKSVVGAIFASPIGPEPFSSKAPARLVVETPLGGFWLGKDQFSAVCEAASQCGDGMMFVSWARGYLGGPELMPYYTWEIDLDWLSYDAIDDQGIDRDHDIGIPLDRLLYSPSGKWGVQTPDDYAALGGSFEFIQAFKLSYPDWKDALQHLLKRFREARLRGTDMTFAQTLMAHVFGSNAPKI
jgi:hypothetical protein